MESMALIEIDGLPFLIAWWILTNGELAMSEPDGNTTNN